MPVWKNGMTTKQAARQVLRSYLVRCHRVISEDYPEVAQISAEDGADFLLHLKETGRIEIILRNTDANHIDCEIKELRQHDEHPSAGE